jgi:hypothetical protein
MSAPHHIQLGGKPYCEHTGCVAGQALAKQAGVFVCGYLSGRQAKAAAKQLRKYRYDVKVVAGACAAA